MSDAGGLFAKLLIVLGPVEEEPPLPAWEEDQDREHRHWERPESWPPANRAPPGGVYWMRWIVGEIGLCGSDQKLKHLADRLQQALVNGSLTTVAVHPWTGALHPIPPHVWQAPGEMGKHLRWSGEMWAGEGTRTPSDIYLIDTAWVARMFAGSDTQDREMSPKEQNSAAKIIATLVLRGRRGFYHGLAAELEREAEVQGHPVSDDTIRMWLKRAEATYDPAKDTKRKS